MHTRLRTMLSVGIVVILLALLPPALARAAGFVVTRTDDPAPDGCTVGDCSLREAILAANGNGPDAAPSPLAPMASSPCKSAAGWRTPPPPAIWISSAI